MAKGDTVATLEDVTDFVCVSSCIRRPIVDAICFSVFVREAAQLRKSVMTIILVFTFRSEWAVCALRAAGRNYKLAFELRCRTR